MLSGRDFSNGIPLAYLMMGAWLQQYAFRIDLGIMQGLLAGVLIVVVTLLSVFTQVIKTARMNPVETLRHEWSQVMNFDL